MHVQTDGAVSVVASVHLVFFFLKKGVEGILKKKSEVAYKYTMSKMIGHIACKYQQKKKVTFMSIQKLKNTEI